MGKVPVRFYYRDEEPEVETVDFTFADSCCTQCGQEGHQSKSCPNVPYYLRNHS